MRSDCAWRLLLHDFPPWPTVYYRFRRSRLSGRWPRIFVAPRVAERKRAGKDDDDDAIVDIQSIKTTGESVGSADVHKNIKGRKRHLLVDTLGFPLSVHVTPADVQGRGAPFAHRS